MRLWMIVVVRIGTVIVLLRRWVLLGVTDAAHQGVEDPHEVVNAAVELAAERRRRRRRKRMVGIVSGVRNRIGRWWW